MSNNTSNDTINKNESISSIDHKETGKQKNNIKKNA